MVLIWAIESILCTLIITMLNFDFIPISAVGGSTLLLMLAMFGLCFWWTTCGQRRPARLVVKNNLWRARWKFLKNGLQLDMKFELVSLFVKVVSIMETYNLCLHESSTIVSLCVVVFSEVVAVHVWRLKCHAYHTKNCN